MINSETCFSPYESLLIDELNVAFKRLMIVNNVTLLELSQKTKISSVHLNSLMAGKHKMSCKNAMLIAEALGYSLVVDLVRNQKTECSGSALTEKQLNSNAILIQKESIALIQEKINRRKQTKKISFATLARKTGFSIGHLKKTMSGNAKMSKRVAFSIAKALDYDLSEDLKFMQEGQM